MGFNLWEANDRVSKCNILFVHACLCSPNLSLWILYCFLHYSLGKYTGVYSESQFVEKRLITSKFYLNSNCHSYGSCHLGQSQCLKMAFLHQVTLQGLLKYTRNGNSVQSSTGIQKEAQENTLNCFNFLSISPKDDNAIISDTEILFNYLHIQFIIF